MKLHLEIAVTVIIALSSVACAESRATETPLPGKPRRIISLAPSVTETLFAVGAGERVSGVTMFCNYPPKVGKLPEVGQFARFNLEKILILEPDMVVATRDAPSETVMYQLERYGIPLHTVSASNIEETIATIRSIGRAVGQEKEADRIAGDMERRLERIEKLAGDLDPVKTLIVYDHEPLILAGPKTFADDIIEKAGGINIASDARIKYPRYSIEKMVLEGPEVIIEAGQMEADNPNSEKLTGFWQSWPSMPAVKNGRIEIVNADLISRPGPRIIEGLEAVARALHPEIAARLEEAE